MEFHGNHKRHFHGIPWKCMERFPWNFVECFHGIPWKLCPNPPWNSMEFFSMEMHGQISLEFHGNFPWNSMEINVLILHGIPWRIFHGTPWNSMEVFHTGLSSFVYDLSETLELKKDFCSNFLYRFRKAFAVIASNGFCCEQLSFTL